MLAAVAGLAGVVFRMLDCPPAPLVLGLVLGPLLEDNLRRSLLLSRGDPTVFVTQPVSLVMLLLTLALAALFTWSRKRQGRRLAGLEVF
jgi:TctA family transporter